jgi:hypothetical protein
MPSADREWDEDPWDHSSEASTWKPKKTPLPYKPSSYQLTTLSPALTRTLEESIRKQIEKTVNDAFQRMMDRLDELQELIERD